MKTTLFIFLTILASPVFSQIDSLEIKGEIDLAVNKINIEKDYMVKTLTPEYFIDVKNEATDGGQELKGYYKNNLLKKMTYSVGLSTQILTYDYYFTGSALMYVVEIQDNFVDIKDETGDVIGYDITEVETGFEAHYYLKDNRIVLMEEYGERRFGDVDTADKERELIDDAKRFATELNTRDAKLSWVFKSGYVDLGRTLLLEYDSTFVYEAYCYTDCIREDEWLGDIQYVYGRYMMEGNTLQLYPERFWKHNLFPDRIDVACNIPYIESDSTTIKTTYTLIQWNDNLYLLSELLLDSYGDCRENDFLRFACLYNSGEEPGFSGSYLSLRNNAERFEPLDTMQMPAKWRSYFLLQPIEVLVTRIEQKFMFDTLAKSYVTRITLAGGSENGIRENMVFYGEKAFPEIDIMQVDKHTCWGYVQEHPYAHPYKLGDKVSTRRPKKDGDY